MNTPSLKSALAGAALGLAGCAIDTSQYGQRPAAEGEEVPTGDITEPDPEPISEPDGITEPEPEPSGGTGDPVEVPDLMGCQDEAPYYRTLQCNKSFMAKMIYLSTTGETGISQADSVPFEADGETFYKLPEEAASLPPYVAQTAGGGALALYNGNGSAEMGRITHSANFQVPGGADKDNRWPTWIYRAENPDVSDEEILFSMQEGIKEQESPAKFGARLKKLGIKFVAKTEGGNENPKSFWVGELPNSARLVTFTPVPQCDNLAAVEGETRQSFADWRMDRGSHRRR